MSTTIYSINCQGKLYTLDRPQVMGILNLTDNSFFDGGKYFDLKNAQNRVHQMIKDGVDIIDIGATTTKPGTPISDSEEEIDRLIPVIKFIRETYPNIWISIDTYHSSVAEKSLQAGAHIINDISGGLIDEKIFDVCAQYRAPYILMHIQGTPETMQLQPQYQNVVQDVVTQLLQQVKKADQAGVKDIIIDPGFGFGKTVEHNFKLMNQLEVFKIFQRPLLVGISRKSMIWKTLDTTPEFALTGTIALNMLSLEKGAHILRVHDVKEAVEVVKIFTALKNRLFRAQPHHYIG